VKYEMLSETLKILIMREFYIKYKDKDVVYRGIIPDKELNCPPLKFFKAVQAYFQTKVMMDYYNHEKYTRPKPNIEEVKLMAYNWVETKIANALKTNKIKTELLDLLKYDNLPKRQQEKKLKGLTLTFEDIICLLNEAENQGYLLDIYHEEKRPFSFDNKKSPKFFYLDPKGNMEKVGFTNMSDSELSTILEQRKVVQARILHKGEHWHCFYFTFKGVNGKEPGENGSKPHWHYLSDKFGITLKDLIQRINDCDMPTSKVHITIERHAKESQS
jgi:hypothetical protein